jgi:hypothetical protein
MKYHKFIFCSFFIILASCSPQKVEQNPNATNENLQTQQATKAQHPIQLNRSHVPVKSLNIIVLPDYPVQVNVAVVVELKDSCTSVKEIYQNQRDDTFLIEMQESYQKQQHCQPQPTLSEYIIPLDVGNLSAGHYTVYVNQKRAHFELMVDN